MEINMAKKKKSAPQGKVKNGVYVMEEPEKFNWFMIPVMFVMFFVPVIVRLTLREFDEQSAEFLGYYGADFYSSVKGVFLMIGMAVMLAAGISGAIICKKITKETDWRIKFFLIAGGAFTLFTLLSASLSDNPIVAFGGFNEQGEGFFTILAYAVAFSYAMVMFEKTKDFRCIAVTLAVVVGLNLIEGVSQYIGHDILRTTDFGRALVVPSKYDNYVGEVTSYLGKEKMFGTLGHYNHMGTFAAMTVPLFTVLTVISKDMKMRITMGITAVASAVLLFGSTARGGLVGVAFAGVLAVIIFGRQLISHWKITLSVAGAGVILAVGLNFATDGRIFSRIPAMISDLLYIGNSETEEDYMSSLPIQKITNSEDGTVTITAGEKELVLSFDKENKFTVSDGSESMKLTDGSVFGGFSFGYEHEDQEASHPEDGDLDLLTLRYEQNPMFWFRGTDDGARLVNPYTLKSAEMQYPPVAEYFKGKEKIGSMRGYIWGRTIPLMKDTFLVGYGPDNFVFKFPQYDYLGKYYAYGTTNMVITRPHNLYLQVFINNGGLAFLAFMAIIILYVVDCFKLYCFKKFYTAEQGLGTALFLAVAGYLGAGMFNDSLKHISVVFWILLGAGAAVNAICRKALKEQK